MPLNDLTSFDISFLALDVLILLVLALYLYNQGTSISKCKKIEISNERLKLWRISLYTSIGASVFGALFTFIIPTPLRFISHPIFIAAVGYMEYVSIPAYVCKKKGFGGTCNCDFYKYNDFEPMVVLGAVGTFVLSIFSLDLTWSLIVLAILILATLIIAFKLPERELSPLKYPPALLITEVDELQQFLMSDPNEKKLLIFLDAKCDFCEIQVDEIVQVDHDLMMRSIRIYDLTYKESIDPILPMTLNIDMLGNGKIPVPTTIIFDSGMAVDQKDGVLSKAEIEALLMF